MSILGQIQNDIIANETETDDSLEIMTVRVSKGETELTIVNCYSTAAKSLPIEGITVEHERFVLLGDFNSHSPSWGYNDLNARAEELENWIIDNNLQILLNEDDPDTFFLRVWGTTSTPDLTLLSEDLTPTATKKVMNQLAGSDHRPILLEVTDETADTTKPPPPRWNYKKANWSKLSSLSTQFTQTTNCKSNKLDKVAKCFTSAILKAAN